MHRLLDFVLNPRSNWTAFAPALLWTIFVLGANSVPGTEFPTVRFPHADKIVHFGFYLPIGFLYARAFSRKVSAIALAGAFSGIALGAFDEVHQLWVPFRSCSLADWLVDCFAAASGGVVFAAIARSNH